MEQQRQIERAIWVVNRQQKPGQQTRKQPASSSEPQDARKRPRLKPKGGGQLQISSMFAKS